MSLFRIRHIRGISQLSLAGLANLPNVAKIVNLHLKYQKNSLKYTQCSIEDYLNNSNQD